jgi:MFS superfamily sulfate permease-like transporter
MNNQAEDMGLERGLSRESRGQTNRMRVIPPTIDEDKVVEAECMSLTTSTINNFNAAIANVIVSVPISLGLVMALNYHAPKGENLDGTTALFTLFFGYVMSALISGHANTFKAFTAAQTFVLILQVSRFGVGSIPLTTFIVGLIIMLFTFVNFHKVLDMTPTCITFGLKFATGLALVVNEISHMLGLPTNPQGRYDLVSVSRHVYDHRNLISPTAVAVCITGVILLSIGMAKKPNIPWHFLFLIIFLSAGYLLSNKGVGVSQVGENWTGTFHLHKEVSKLLNEPLHSRFSKTDIVTNAGFLVNCGALAFVTLLEATALIKIVEFYLKTIPDKKAEYLGLGLTNTLAGIFGLLPTSLPLGRNLLGIKAGANSVMYQIFCALLTVLFGYFIWGFMNYLPVVLVSIFNISLAYFLIDFSCLKNYWKMSPKYAAVTTTMLVLSLFTNIIVAMIVSWLIFLIIYRQVNSVESYWIGDIDKIVEEANIFECTNLNSLGDPYRVNILHGEEVQPLVRTQSKSKEVLQRIASQGFVYEFKGRYSFQHYRTHLANIRHFDKDLVLINFKSVFSNDSEFIVQYLPFIRELGRAPIAFFVTGIPYKRVMEDMLLQDTWITKLKNDHQLIFIN